MKRRYVKLISLTLILILVAYINCHILMLLKYKAFASADWLDGWKYRRQLTINSSLVDESLTNFPVLVVLDASFFDFTKAKDNGEDIRFTSSDGTTLLAYEIERWNKTAGKAEIWVKIPSVSDISDTDFFIYYGNPSVSDAQDPRNVWDENYVLVYHLKEPSGTVYDSTFNGNNGSPYGNLNQNAVGKIDGADDFDNTDDYINVPHSSSLNYGDVVTFELWLNPRASTFKGGIDKGTGTCYILGDGTGKIRLGKSGTGTLLLSTSAIPTNKWLYVAAVKNGTATNGMKIYINGNLDNQGTTTTICSNNTSPLYIGKRPAYSEFLNSIADEIRISNTPRTGAWLKASYYSENNSLLTYGNEEGVAPVYSNIGYDSTHAGSPCNFYVKWSDPDGLSTCIFTTNNTGTWQNQTIPVSGTESWANITLTLNSTTGATVGFRWYCNDTLGNMGDTNIRTLVTTGDWQYAIKIWFNNTAIAENLLNFPVMINLSRAGVDFWNHVGQTPKDLRFVDSDCITDLYFEVEYWNYTTQEAYVWVNVPKINAGSSGDFIYVYYGNPSPPDLPYNNPIQVWDSNFVMVHHLEEDSGVHYDSTSKYNDGYPQGGVAQGIKGRINGADSLDGVNDYINCGSKSSLTVTSMTIEAWVNRLGTGVATYTGAGGFYGEPIIAKGRAYVETLGLNVNYFLAVNQTGNVIGFDFEDNYNGGNHPVFSNTAIQNNQWYYIVATYDGITSKIYINGILDNSLTISKTPDFNPWAATIGSAISDEGGTNTPKGFFKGIIDEVRISNVARTDEWIKAQYLSMSDQYITFGIEQTPNNPPDKPFNPSPAHGSIGVPTSTLLSVNVSDPDGDAMDVYFYQPGVEGPSTSDFTIIVLPDTQYYSQSYPQIFDNQTQWIVNNKESMNIVFVTHEGDIVEIYSDLTQWQNANNSMSKLDNVVPWGILPGNHDGAGVNLTNYNTYFGYERFSGKSWYGGAYQNDNANSYQLFSGGADDYLIFHFQYAPSDDVLAWANVTINNYPNRRVIVVTHDYLGTDGSRSSNGEAIWQKFVKPHADQVFLVLCGHATAEARRTDNVGGHVVYQLLADYQSRSNGGNGWLRILRFSPVEDKIYVKTYSPYLNRYETDSDSEFTLDYDMTSSSSTEPTLIGVDTDVPSGGIASVLWTGLNYLTTYSWYAIAYDTQGAFRQSDTWNFTTAEFNMPPIASFTENATIVFTYDVIHFDASDSYDPDGTIIDYFWDFGDGTNATGITVDHSYANNGTYIVTLTVTDDKGMTASTNASKIVLNKPDIAVEHIAFSKSVVGQGDTIQINVTVANQGDFIETFNVTLYANTTAIETREITLTSLNSTTITYTWNTNGFAKGNYTLWAYAWPVQGEIDTADNTFVDGLVVVAMPGDINADGIVDIFDCVKIALAYASTPSDPNWDPNANINNDNIIDIFDLVIVAIHFAETDP